MSIRFENIPHRRAIIDRRLLTEQLQDIDAASKDSAKLRLAAVPLFREALVRGREEIARRLLAAPSRGNEIASSYAFLTDQLLRAIFDFTTGRLYP
ncbi:MAG: bifunctional uridylyltransferase/uridylyl-removing protein, partial [Sphingomonadaceae bacterium]